MKHTKGPWTVLWSSNKFPSIHSGPTQTPVAVLYEYVSETDRDLIDNAEANAQLIAAAPELLDALKNMYEMYVVLAAKDHTKDDSLMMAARQAIAKAEGSEK